MSNDLWRWAGPDGRQQDARLEELRAALADGRVAPDAPVLKPGAVGWLPANQVPELTSTVAGDIPPPPAAMMSVLRQYESGSLPPASDPTLRDASAPLKTQIGGSAIGRVTVPSPTQPAPITPRTLGRSMPTTLGMAPPPEFTPGSSPRPNPTPPPIPVATDAHPVAVEESGREMLGSDALIEVPNQPAPGGDLPAPTDPVVHEFVVEETFGGTKDLTLGDALPRPFDLRKIAEDIAAVRQGRPPQNKLRLGVVAGLALALGILLIAGLVSIVGGLTSSSKSAPAASASASAAAIASAELAPTASAPVAKASPPASAPTPKEPALADCRAAGSSTRVAPRAVVGTALEASALETGIALGFAAAARDAVAASLDPSTLTATKTAHAKVSGGDARRVTPVLAHGKVTPVADVDRKGDKLGSRRVVPLSNLIDIGSADGGLVWTAHGRDSFSKLFTLDDSSRVEALRAAKLAGGFALAFRQGNAVYAGMVKGEDSFEPQGGLSKLSSSGQVGSPAIAASGDQALVAWADRADSSSDWKIHLARIKAGGADAPIAFALPPGGLGGQAMSPSLASLGGGRFLLAWTEGMVSNHQVRAITIGSDGKPSGDPIAISATGINAGQPAAVVTADGHGAVAFLAAKGKTFEVHAAPLSCSPR
jgi:hypothetical protein